jgi:Ser/Thr protein kinase RdoA (MazF antagonist)
MSENVAAAVEVARRLGIPVEEPVVLRDLGNTLLHLAPSRVVARVWPRGRRDPSQVVHELLVTAYLASAGARVAPPYEDPGPHESGDRTVTLWQLVDHDETAPLDAAAAARALHEIHDLLVDPAAPDLSGLPHFARVDEAAGVVAALDVTGEDRAGLDQMLALAAPALARLDLPEQPLHGDAWLGNVLRTPDGPVWSDFELACRGPREVDLCANEAVARHRGRSTADDDFRAGYGAVDWDLVSRLEPLALVPITAWTFRLAQERPDFLDAARQRLARALEGLTG